jgi:hypothetical protein
MRRGTRTKKPARSDPGVDRPTHWAPTVFIGGAVIVFVLAWSLKSGFEPYPPSDDPVAQTMVITSLVSACAWVLAWGVPLIAGAYYNWKKKLGKARRWNVRLLWGALIFSTIFYTDLLVVIIYLRFRSKG